MTAPTSRPAQSAGHRSVTPHLVVRGAAQALDFYRRAFDAVERGRCELPNGTLGHAELMVGDSLITLADEFPDLGYLSPLARGGSTVVLRLDVEDVDAAFARALAAGATLLRPVQDQFYGDRAGTLVDPFGHVWTLATHVEDVPADELERRMQSLFKT